MNKKVIITGATGMVGEGVLHECLQHPDIAEVLLLNRRPSGVTHPKVKELIQPDFLKFSEIQFDFTPYDACFFCLGVSSVGMSKEEYYRATYELTMGVAKTLVAQNPNLIFCYVSGAGTDSSEKGSSNWARVKGKTENDLLKLPFKKAYMFRPGFLQPTPGLNNTLKMYSYIKWLVPLLRPFLSNYMSTLQELGLAMINVVEQGYGKPILEVKDIKALAKF
ncbi:NAD-dependent epimerase/dehydratase family protein [Adhaeribacter radiodurans]|uniref:NAD-dependent epimerase/dehydratase family protein n=1 Tax=Adhaeribacter radiodurans TaxID=2745197 RepID=A0A7L7L8N7_9BACT|nr:NAD-dependent epimerase/dehydratase family protein [Adhaeribacter radiodurans]QMU29103.1 NAD-dependent epimerase/dehydratase family protein [Adhaeribacter radiodurans]